MTFSFSTTGKSRAILNKLGSCKKYTSVSGCKNTSQREIFVSDMGRLGVSVQAFKELEKKYMRMSMLYILNNWVRTVGISDSNTNQEDEDAVVAEHFHYCRKSTEEVIWM